MNIIDKYLQKVDRALRPLPISERLDIIKEIHSSMNETDRQWLNEAEIIAVYGQPQTLAKSYLSDLLEKPTTSKFHRLLLVIAFYSLTSISGLVVVPTLVIIAPTFIFTGIITPIFGLIKMIGYLVNIDIPWIMYQIGSYQLNPVFGFVLSLIIGFGLYKLGRILWSLLKTYLNTIRTHKPLSPNN